MPEGPELHLSSLFINRICHNLTFSGKVVRNPIHKCPDINWNESAYSIAAESRGKELMLHLRSCSWTGNPQKLPTPSFKDRVLSILFTFGMSGKFEFAPVDEMPKHSHLIFHTKQEPKMGLAFVDYRRFGKWVEGGQWSVDRGPCILQEHNLFVNHVAANLDNRSFDKPICEVMLNQKFFNGIGNYLRAEILYRCKVAPFEKARSVLKSESRELTEEEIAAVKSNCDVNTRDEEGIKKEKDGAVCHDQKRNTGSDRKVERVIKEEISKDFEKIESTDVVYKCFTEKGKELLMLCGSVPLEVIDIGSTKYSLSDMYKDDTEGKCFNDWLQCYYQDGMRNMADHNNRTIWFTGPAGPLAPKEQKIRGKKKTKKTTIKDEKDTSDNQKGESITVNGNDGEKKAPSDSQTMTRKKLKSLKGNKTVNTAEEEKLVTQPKKKSTKLSESRKRKEIMVSETPAMKKKAKRNGPEERKPCPKRLTRSSLKCEGEL